MPTQMQVRPRLAQPDPVGKTSPSHRASLAACLRVCLAACLLVAGCVCTSRQLAARRTAQLWTANYERAQPEMRAAAHAVGAQLLPAKAQGLRLNYCRPGESKDTVPQLFDSRVDGCITWIKEDQSAFRFLDAQGRARMGIVVRPEVYHYTRLARRLSTFFVLDPVVSRRTIGSFSQCECSVWPAVNFDPNFFAFIIDTVSDVAVRTLQVPMREDTIEWKCEAF